MNIILGSLYGLKMYTVCLYALNWLWSYLNCLIVSLGLLKLQLKITIWSYPDCQLFLTLGLAVTKSALLLINNDS